MHRTDNAPVETDVVDLYLASYLLLNGCKLIEVQCIPTGGAVSCRLFFSGPRIPELEDEFFKQSAMVNLLAFRSAYNQVNGYIHQAKKSFDRSRREDGRRSEEESGAGA